MLLGGGTANVSGGHAVRVGRAHVLFCPGGWREAFKLPLNFNGAILRVYLGFALGLG